MTFAATTFRLANYETPLWALPNPTDGRYNRAGTGPTQYLSLHPMTPWAEVLRNEDRRTRERALLLRYPIWAVKLELAEAPLRLTFGAAGKHGLDPEDLVSDDEGACQAFAEGVRGSVSAFTAPSTALPGTTNLVILEPAVVTFYEAEPVAAEDLPTAMVAQDGRCPEGLWDLVHFKASRTTHPGLHAWREQREHEFEEPIVSAATLAA